jgi:hypothetical protein
MRRPPGQWLKHGWGFFPADGQRALHKVGQLLLEEMGEQSLLRDGYMPIGLETP